MDLYMLSAGSVAHRQQHGLVQQYGPWTSTWTKEAAQAMDINISSGGNMDHGHQYVLSISTKHGCHHGF